MTLPSSSRGGQRVRLVVLHTAEGAATNAALFGYFDRTQVASCHAGIDEHGVSDGWVPYDRAAWTLRNGNPYSDNAEICGWAKWTRAEWLAHPGMLAGAAAWVRSRCLARGIPIVKLTPAQVKAGQAGVCGHVDYTNATGDGTHWDPGPNFPWDIVINAAKGGGGGSSPAADQEDDLTPDQDLMLRRLYGQATGTEDVKAGFPGFPSLEYPQSKATPVDFIRAMDQNIIHLTRTVEALAAEVEALKAAKP